MNCSGIDALTGAPVAVEFADTIMEVRDAPGLREASYLSPGFIDIQVNGFAGVDYNRPDTAHSEVARSIRALFATGVTRFYPTVITGPPGDMTAALANLSRAKDT